MKKIISLALLALLLVTAAACTTQAGQAINNTINVAGLGKVTAEPDTVEIRLSVITEGADKSVQEENAVEVQKMIDALLALGLTEDNLETQGLNFNPLYRWDETKGQQIIGYHAESSLLVKTTDLEKTGAIVDTAIQNGADLAGNLNFSLSDEGKAKLLDLAIEKAVIDAKNQADLTAKAAGVTISGIQNINVVKESQSPPIYYDLMEASKASSATPVIPEETEYIVTIQAAFIIK